MQKINLTLVLIGFILGTSVAQGDSYQTKKANLQVYGEFKGENFIGTSNDLLINLDYETTEIEFKLKLKNLKFSIDSLNKIIQTNNQEIVFNGTLSLEHINTDEHPPLNFTMEGWTEIKGERRKILGNGQLHHSDLSKDSSCILGIVMSINLSDVGVEIPNLKDDIKIVIKQAILEKDRT
ncbi:MAG: hypothetical protein P1U56_14120 [Saprospiraceae bacterium]|nr:hypothetical protein [Saprospiraceae bacterium]